MHVYFTSEDVTTNPLFGIAELSSLTINEFPELLSYEKYSNANLTKHFAQKFLG